MTSPTAATWEDVTRVLLGSWQNLIAGWGREGIAAYCAELAARHVDPAAAITALRAHGGEFPPSAAALAASLRPARRTPAEAWELVERAVRRVGVSIYNPLFAEHHQAAIDWLAEQDRVVAAWAARRGLCGPGSLGAEPVLDPDHGGAITRRLHVEFDQIAEAAEQRALAGGEAIPDRLLLVRDTGSRSGDALGDLLERLRPTDELPATTRERRAS